MKILKSRKALSPVVASIILIAVTVAVSLAVAIWMGALTTGFMGSGEQLQVGNPWGWTTNAVYVNITNTGGSSITISAVRVSGQVAIFSVNYYDSNCIYSNNQLTLKPGGKAGLQIKNPSGNWTRGIPYTITIVTAANHEFTTQGVPPGA